MKVYHANVPVLPSAEIQNSKHKFGHDEALPAPTTGGWTAGAVVMEIQTDLNSKKNEAWSQFHNIYETWFSPP